MILTDHSQTTELNKLSEHAFSPLITAGKRTSPMNAHMNEYRTIKYLNYLKHYKIISYMFVNNLAILNK